MLPSGYFKDEDSDQEQKATPTTFPETHLTPAPPFNNPPQHPINSSRYLAGYGTEPDYYSYMIHPFQPISFSPSRGKDESIDSLSHSSEPVSTTRLTEETMLSLTGHSNQTYSQQQQQQQHEHEQEEQFWIPAIPTDNCFVPGYEQREQDLFGRLVSMARSPASTNQTNTWYPLSSSSWVPEFDLDMGEGTSNYMSAGLPKPRIVPSQDARRGFMQYEVQIVQQPSRARSCGFSDKDRRPISPAPILQLIVRGLDGAIVQPQDVDTSFLLMQCDCRDAITKKPASIVLYPASEKQQRKETPRGMSNLVGACIASPAKLYNEQGELGIYFIFPELSVRSEGRFCLAFLLLNIGTSNTPRVVNTETISHVLTTTFSDVFTSYTAKRFPGVIPPTALSKCFGSQGIKIPTRRDTRTKQITTKDSIAENHANDSDNDEYK